MLGAFNIVCVCRLVSSITVIAMAYPLNNAPRTPCLLHQPDWDHSKGLLAQPATQFVHKHTTEGPRVR